MNSGVRGALAILGGGIYVVGVVVLMTVTTTTGDPLELLPALYHGLRFFILELYGIPLEGPPGAIAGFWVAAFLAPALLAGKLLDYVRVAYAQAGHSFGFGWGRKAPVVVCGFGMHGRAVAKVAVEAGHRVIVVDSGDLSDGTGTVSMGPKSVRYVRGDITTEGVLRRAEVHRALQVWFCAGDPNVNLLAARSAAKMVVPGGATELVPMVDEGWDVSTIRTWAERHGIVPFLQFEQAATAILENNRFGAELNAATLAGKTIAIVGFGRLGVAVLSLLAKRSSELRVSALVLVIDPRAKGKVETWKMRNAARWGAIEVRAVESRGEEFAWPDHERPVVAFICTSDDHSNIRMAHHLQERATSSEDVPVDQPVPSTLVVLRMFDTQMANMVSQPISSDALPRELVAMSLESLMEEAARRRLPASSSSRSRAPASSPEDSDSP